MNESAASFKWLSDNLRLSDPSHSPCRAVWAGVRDKMRATPAQIGSMQDWISDFWLCKSSEIGPIVLVPTWHPPDEIDHWQTLPTDLRHADVLNGARPTNHEGFERTLALAAEVHESDSDDAVSDFQQLYATEQLGNVAMFQAEHVRAWLSTSLGNLLSSIAFSPQSFRVQLVGEAYRRLLIPRELKAAPLWGVQFEEGELGLLYNCRQSPRGELWWGGIRIGQGDQWLKTWPWLSQPTSEEVIIPALQLAARLLRCRILLDVLRTALAGDERGLQLLALAVVRRWLLSLKVMAWLEDALGRPRKFLRP